LKSTTIQIRPFELLLLGMWYVQASNFKMSAHLVDNTKSKMNVTCEFYQEEDPNGVFLFHYRLVSQGVKGSKDKWKQQGLNEAKVVFANTSNNNSSLRS